MGAGIMNTVDLEVIKNKLSSLSQLQDSLIPKQADNTVVLVQIGLGNLKATWNMWWWLNTTFWLLYKQQIELGNKTA